MRITIDTEARTLACEDQNGSRSLPLYSDEAFEAAFPPVGQGGLESKIRLHIHLAGAAYHPIA